MTHKRTAGRARLSKKIGLVLGTAAVGLMVVLPLAINGLQMTTQSTPGPGRYSAFTLPPTMNMGATETTTVPPAVPATAKGGPGGQSPA
jgi:hypothetical protein